MLRAPLVRSEEDWTLELLRRDVVAHPGHFYELDHGAHLVLSLIVGFAVMEFASRRYQTTVRATANDTKLELLMLLSLVAVAQPVALLGADRISSWLMPGQRDAWAELPWWAMFGILLVVDDMTQYWWHRVSHTPLLWPLHRAHHSARYMSIRITFRNNFFYYLLMPGLWLAGVLF